MNTTKVSSKYQIVIPKELRKKLNIKPGQRLAIELNKSNDVVIQTGTTPLEELGKKYGGRNIWGKDPVATIRKMRDEWDKDETGA